MTFEALKARQAEMWGSAPFERISDDAAAIHDDLVARLGVKPAERWLDVATGTGAVARRAARLGAVVTGQDLAPPLIETARRISAEEGLEIAYEAGDCERLPYPDASFDVVSSAQGAVFAPDHRAVAHELTRVCRPGGRLGLTAWRPGGGIEAFFRVLRRFQPPPPEEAGDPLSWGRREHAMEMLDDGFSLSFFEGDAPHRLESGETGWELFSTAFGPVKTLADSLDGDRRSELKHAFIDYFEQYREADGISAPREYVVIIGRRRGG